MCLTKQHIIINKDSWSNKDWVKLRSTLEFIGDKLRSDGVCCLELNGFWVLGIKVQWLKDVCNSWWRYQPCNLQIVRLAFCLKIDNSSSKNVRKKNKFNSQ